MAKVKAIVSFAGAVSMYKGEVKEVSDENIVKDLLNAKYIELVEKEKAEKPTKSKKGDK
jgi:molybdopterin synthase catalytic subunit